MASKQPQSPHEGCNDVRPCEVPRRSTLRCAKPMTVIASIWESSDLTLTPGRWLPSEFFVMKGESSKADLRKADSRLAVRKQTKKDKQAAKDPNKPKRAPSVFFVFIEGFSGNARKSTLKTNQFLLWVGEAAVEKWKSMIDEEKAPFVAKAEKKKEYERQMEDYNRKLSGDDDGDDDDDDDDDEMHQTNQSRRLMMRKTVRRGPIMEGLMGPTKFRKRVAWDHEQFSRLRVTQQLSLNFQLHPISWKILAACEITGILLMKL
ncbi:High mobility group B protein 2 [Striga hermonthica]|uniref:High mobility group B protein 2 n=1 Tax=Striga hermonthica TaxID=68872 RepID=A0A9N7MWR9_STRHE|nr:High mobility group B protein 2 [Striga hermonthica]